MKNIVDMIQTVITAIGAFFGGILGGFDGFLYALIAFVIIDYVTGVMVGILQKKLSSSIGFKGIFKKVLIFIMVAIAHIVDKKVLGTGSSIRTAVIFFYVSNEGISILENAVKIGLPVPEKLKNILKQLKDEGSEIKK